MMRLLATIVVETAAYAANRILEALFPSIPDDLMGVADAAGVTANTPAAVDEGRARARAAAAKRAKSPAMQRTRAPWFEADYEELLRSEVDLLAAPAVRDAAAELEMRWQLGQGGTS